MDNSVNSPSDMHAQARLMAKYFDEKGVDVGESLAICGYYVSVLMSSQPPEVLQGFIDCLNACAAADQASKGNVRYMN